jgi:RNA polymerase sigma-B factor
LIESHLPLVRAIARRYVGRGEAVEDLVQVGALGLIRASDRFDPSRGVAFATFAAPAIEGEIRRHLGDRTTTLRIPRELQRMTGQLQRRRAELLASLGREPSVDELATALGAEREDVERALEAARARDSGSDAHEVDDVAGDYEFGPTSDDRLLLARGARVLDERERRIVFLRFHADMTERDIASEIGISQAHVSRLLAGALTKLREELEDEQAGSPGAGQGSPATPQAEPSEPHQSARQETQNRAAAQPDRNRIPTVAASQDSAEPTVAEATEEMAGRSRRTAKRKTGSGQSGRFLVRMPSTLHQELSEAAEREQVSLNRYVNDTLAASLAPDEEGAVERPDGIDAPADSIRPAAKRNFRMLLAANVIVMVVAGVAAVVLLILAFEQGL